jgi:hypothetical protein
LSFIFSLCVDMMSPAQHSNHVPHPPAYQNYPTNQLSPSSTNSYSSSVSTFTGSDNSPYIPSYPYNYVPNYGQATMPTHCPSNGSSPTSDTSEGPGHVGSGGRGVLLADSVSPPNYSGYYAQPNGDIRSALEISRQHEWKQKKSRPHQSNGPYSVPHRPRIQGPCSGSNVHATATSGALESNGSSPTSDTSEGPGHVGIGGRVLHLADGVSPTNYPGYYMQPSAAIRPAPEISRQHEWKQKKSQPHQSNGPYNPPGIQGPSRGNNVHATATPGALVSPGWPNQTLPILQVGFLSLSNHSNTSK